uniref:PSI subunit V n=1 Tax=Zooxanthella nutricula TaxID=1333877 RepID=A0A7S2KVW4_9DINO|mmetsp:Transcript_53005/g.161045  ORF Transcript_53005/g.161045 Transcript_53005/m.161045 type:complete len:208 (+) Transcript_53005:2-625(+)
MGWWDFWYLKLNQWEPDEVYLGDLTDKGMTGLETELRMEYGKKLDREGATPLSLPVFPGVFQPTGAYIQWRGKEYWAGDQVQTPVSDGKFAVDFLNNTAFYRAGLKPWQRGLEIGMAHGYWIIGPFVSLGPLRNTPEAATVGLLCGCAIVGLASCGGLLVGATLKPTFLDREGDAKAAGWQEMINWHALGGLGGAGFAHALLTVFGS